MITVFGIKAMVLPATMFHLPRRSSRVTAREWIVAIVTIVTAVTWSHERS